MLQPYAYSCAMMKDHQAELTGEHSLDWCWQAFDQLDQKRLYAIMAARVAVFVVEQNCPYQELDGQDDIAHHLSVWNEQQTLLAYLRVLPASERFAAPSIGRVITLPAARGRGLGRPLMRHGIEYCHQRYPQQDILLSAQHHLEPFYRSLGFVGESAVYLEDGIPHIDMRLRWPDRTG